MRRLLAWVARFAAALLFRRVEVGGEERYPRGWPSVLVSIADRHVARDFVTIDERVDDMARRHPEFSEEIERSRHLAHALEAELAEVVGLQVDELIERLRAAWEAGEGA